MSVKKPSPGCGRWLFCEMLQNARVKNMSCKNDVKNEKIRTNFY
jgi:hypothetical protein